MGSEIFLTIAYRAIVNTFYQASNPTEVMGSGIFLTIAYRAIVNTFSEAPRRRWWVVEFFSIAYRAIVNTFSEAPNPAEVMGGAIFLLCYKKYLKFKTTHGIRSRKTNSNRICPSSS